MGLLDIVLTVCVIPAMLRGALKGFISQAFGLVGLVAGAWLAFHFSEIVCDEIARHVGGIPESTLHIVGFVLVLVAVILLMSLLGRLLKGLFRFASLGWVDHLLGLAFGTCTAVLVAGLVIILIDSVNAHYPFISNSTLAQSKLYAPVRDVAYAIFPYLKALLFKQ